jgi:hypothetical protein
VTTTAVPGTTWVPIARDKFGTWLSLAPGTGGTGPTHGEAQFNSTFSISGASRGTWVDSGLSITLPGAGTYRLTGRCTGAVSVAAAPASISGVAIFARLYNATTSAAITNSECTAGWFHAVATGASQDQRTGSIEVDVTVSGGNTIKMQVWLDDPGNLVGAGATATVGGQALGGGGGGMNISYLGF